MTDESADGSERDLYKEELDAVRLKARISAVVDRTKPVPVAREDGTVLLRGRRRADRTADASDRRNRERRKPGA